MIAEAVAAKGAMTGSSWRLGGNAMWRLMRSAPSRGRVAPGLSLSRDETWVEARGLDVDGLAERGRPIGEPLRDQRIVAFSDLVVSLTRLGRSKDMAIGVVKVAARGDASLSLAGLAARAGDGWLEADDPRLGNDPARGDPDVAALRRVASDLVTLERAWLHGIRLACPRDAPGERGGWASLDMGPADDPDGLVAGVLSAALEGMPMRDGWTRNVHRGHERLESGWMRAAVAIHVEASGNDDSRVLATAARTAAARRMLRWTAAHAPGLVGAARDRWTGDRGGDEGMDGA